MKGLLVFGALAALVAVAAWLLYPKTERSTSPAILLGNDVKREEHG